MTGVLLRSVRFHQGPLLTIILRVLPVSLSWTLCSLFLLVADVSTFMIFELEKRHIHLSKYN